MDPVTIGLLASTVAGAGLSWMSNSRAVRESEKNREFQERMSSTAHQREVADLRAAGLNPILSAHRGASTPGGSTPNLSDLGEGVSRGVSNALAVRQARAQIGLTDAQTQLAAAQAAKTNVEAGDIWATQHGRLSLTAAQAAVASADADQRRQLMPQVLERAKAEVASVKAATLLDQLAASGARNVAAFEKQIGEKGPWVRLLFELMRAAPIKAR